MRALKNPVEVEVNQWFKNGDHPQDESRQCYTLDKLKPFLSEGKIVRYYRRPDVKGPTECNHCGRIMHEHGWIDTLEGGHIVCPGDWIITGIKGGYYPCKPDIFDKTYDIITDRIIDLKSKWDDSKFQEFTALEKKQKEARDKQSGDTYIPEEKNL